MAGGMVADVKAGLEPTAHRRDLAGAVEIIELALVDKAGCRDAMAAKARQQSAGKIIDPCLMLGQGDAGQIIEGERNSRRGRRRISLGQP